MAEKTHAPDQSLIAPGCPIVTLAGREWFVPVLAMRQARVVVPAIMKLLPAIPRMKSGDVTALDAETFDLIITAVHGALTRAYPSLSRDEFLDLPASTNELAAAIGVVTRQTGFFKPAEEAAPGETKGETASGSTAPHRRSTGSSPTTAKAPAKHGQTA